MDLNEHKSFADSPPSSSTSIVLAAMDVHERQEKDFLATIFPSDGGQQDMYTMAFNQQPMQQQSMPSPMNPPQLGMDMLNNLMSMQGIESQAQTPSSPQYNSQQLLEQQFKLTQLQQLQQLQNQIFQQQIALISSQTAGMMNSPSVEPRRDPQNHFNGLPTPGPSAEIHAQQPSLDFVSPIVLSNSFLDSQSQPRPQEPFRPDLHMQPINPHHAHPINPNFTLPRGAASAPEHIAFRNIPSPADLDFDISPLASPWLGAQPQHHSSMGQYPTGNKRSASSSGDEANGMPSRKRQSPAIRPTNPSISGQKKYFRATKSTTSTPLIRSTRSRKGSIIGDHPGDSPSPVDLSMPPPAPPMPAPASSSSSSSASEQVPSSPHFNPQMTPVTPASIMKLGRLGVNPSMAPPTRQIIPLKAADPKTKESATTGAAKPKAAPAPKTTRKTAAGVSPSLKAILPAGPGPHSMPLSSPAIHPTPVVQVRKTSHKAAEQKRRDSLKTTFDELRVLLPPIPLPTDDKYPADEILPGALPPRGPPKAGGDGPNKGVSKLQLLMCGNDYIRILKGRIDRRDEEIEKLRGALRKMKLGVPLAEGEEDVDLDKDLDAVEALGGGVLGFGSGSTAAVGTMMPIGEDDGDDDPGEE
ncbi:hypothetical protein H0H92_003648 [Tricholoma furcatifolium]|nr:hypothetical protein H0H92_003648 [Tricholoma furcatifolium]